MSINSIDLFRNYDKEVQNIGNMKIKKPFPVCRGSIAQISSSLQEAQYPRPFPKPHQLQKNHNARTLPLVITFEPLTMRNSDGKLERVGCWKLIYPVLFHWTFGNAVPPTHILPR